MIKCVGENDWSDSNEAIEGSFPREMTLDGQTLLLTNYNSNMLSLIDLSKLPA